MRARQFGHFFLALAMAATITAVAEVARPSVAHADDPVVLISAPPAPGSGGSINFEVSSLGGSTTVVNPGGTAPVKDVCIPASATGSTDFCLGSSDKEAENQGQPFEIGGYATKPRGLPGASMDWLIDEAATAVAIEHGVKNDAMLRAFARPEIRAHVAGQLLLILNKKLYGKTMEPREDSVYDALEAAYKQRQVDQAAQALKEYDAWNTNPCGYTPPAPPAGSGLPVVPNPAKGTLACSKAGALTGSFTFTKGTPPAATFDAWAAYRSPTPAMTHANDPAFRQMSVATTSAIVLTVGTGLALGVGIAGGFAAVAYVASVAAYTAAMTNMLAEAVVVTAAEVFAEMVGSVGALVSTVAGVVTIVLTGIIIGAIAIYQLVEDGKPGGELRERAANAAKQTDALGIIGRQADYAGLDMDTLEDPSGEPKAAIHDAAFIQQLISQSNEWQMFTDQGNLIADPVTLADQASFVPTSTDYKFLVNGVEQPSITLLAPQGAVGRNGQTIAGYRVRFSRGWLMVAEIAPVTGAVGPYLPRLSVDYLAPDGSKGQMSVLHHGEEGQAPQVDFQLTKPANGTATSTLSQTWSFKQNVAENKTVTLQTAPRALPTINVVPSAQGDMVADHNILISANASTETPTVGTSYTWTLQRLDTSGNVAETIPVDPDLVAFQRRFTEAGRYRAKVTVAGNNGAPFSASGRVEFYVNEPEPELMTAAVEDDRVLDGKLFLNLRMLQNTRQDTFDVDVEWARDALGTPVTKSYTVTCENAGGDTCDTGPLVVPDSAPTNANWSESPSFYIPDDQNFLPYVTVTVTNSYGQEFKRVFPIQGDHRPSYASMTPSVVAPVGTPFSVDVVEVFPSPLLVESQDLTILPYVQQIAAQLPPGAHPDIEERNGHWYLQIGGEVSSDAIGTHTFYFPFEQEPNGSGLRPPPALATVEFRAAADPGYRAILRNVPASLAERDYRNVYPAYQVQVAQVLEDGQSQFTPFTGTVKCKLTANGQTVFDKTCAQDQPFPWPAERHSGSLFASVYVQSASQPISTDGPYAVNLLTDFVDGTVLSPPTTAEARTRTFSLRVDDHVFPVPPPFATAGYTVTCSQDGKAFAPCFTNSAGTLTLYRVPGNHTLDVKVKAPDGQSETQRFSWAVTLAAKTLGLKLSNATRKRGTKMTVTGSLLLPGESYKVTIGGIVVATGKAGNLGGFTRTVTVPARLAPKKYAVQLIGGKATRKAIRYLTVTR